MIHFSFLRAIGSLADAEHMLCHYQPVSLLLETDAEVSFPHALAS